jgi:hypothetical protein
MPVKPSDVFLGVVNFLGILLPGAVFVFLLSPYLSIDSSWRDWRVFAVAAYLSGQILLAASELLNWIADQPTKWLWRELYFNLHAMESNFVKQQMGQRSGETENNQQSPQRTGFRFHTALSQVRLHNPEAASEIDHHMADYKMLRSLVLVLLVVAGVSLFHRKWAAGMSETVLAILVYCCFVRMYAWAQYLAFEYGVILLQKHGQTTAAM